MHCDYCGHTLTRDEWDAHVPSCKAAHRGRKKKAAGSKSAVSDKTRAKLVAIEEARKAGEDITAVAVPNADSKSLGGAFDPFANLDVSHRIFQRANILVCAFSSCAAEERLWVSV